VILKNTFGLVFGGCQEHGQFTPICIRWQEVSLFVSTTARKAGGLDFPALREKTNERECVSRCGCTGCRATGLKTTNPVNSRVRSLEASCAELYRRNTRANPCALTPRPLHNSLERLMSFLGTHPGEANGPLCGQIANCLIPIHRESLAQRLHLTA